MLSQLHTKPPALALAGLFIVAASSSQVWAAWGWGVAGPGSWPSAAHHQAVVDSMTAAINRYNAYSPNFTTNDYMWVYHDPGVGTADANFGNSDIRFGSNAFYANENVALHEVGHTLGMGNWNWMFSGGVWTGPRASALVKQFDGEQATLNQSGVHQFPYGLNNPAAGDDLTWQRFVAMIYAQRADVGFGPTSHPSSATTATLTASDAFGTSSFNRHYNWDDGYFAHAGADYRTSNFLLRTPESSNDYKFYGDSLTINNTNGIAGGLLYKGVGTQPVVTIDDLILDGGYVRNGVSSAGGLFQLAGNVTLQGDPTINADQGGITIHSSISGTGSLNLVGGRTITLTAANNTYSGSTNVASGTTLVVEGTTGFGTTNLSNGGSLAGSGIARGALSAQPGSTLRVGGVGLQSSPAMVVTNGAFENGVGDNVANVTDWLDNNAGAFYNHTWQTNNANISHDGSGVAFFSADDDSVGGDSNDGGYLYQELGTAAGSPSLQLEFDWGGPADDPGGRDLGLTVGIYAYDGVGAFTPQDGTDIRGAAGVTLLDSQSFTLVDSTPGGDRRLSESVTFDLSAAGTRQLFLRFNNYEVTREGESWLYLDNVELTGGVPQPLLSESLTVMGDLHLQTNATLEVDISENIFDTLNVEGAATLDGVLSIALHPGFTPNPNEQFTVLTASSITNNLTLGGPDGDLFTLIHSTPNAVVLTAISGLEGDYNNDGQVNLADYTVWRDTLGQSGTGLAADGNGNGAVDLDDYGRWKANYGMSSLSSASTGARVPEPSCMLLAFVGLFIGRLACRDRRWKVVADADETGQQVL